METVNNNVHHVMHTALESQERNEQLFGQLSSLRSQLLASFPDQLICGGSLPRPSRIRHGYARHSRRRLDSERLCEIDDPALNEVAPPSHVPVESVAAPSDITVERVVPPSNVTIENVTPKPDVSEVESRLAGDG